MANNKIKLVSNVGIITSGITPTTDNLLPGQAAFGKLNSDDKYHLFGNTGEDGDKGKVVDIIVDTISSTVHPSTLEQVLTAGKQTTLDITFDASTGNVTIVGHDGVSVSDGSRVLSMKAGEGFKDNGSAILSANPDNIIDASEQNQMRSAIGVLSETEVKALVSKVYRIKGTVQSFDVLINDTTYTPEVGDVWNIKTAGGKDRHDIDIKAGDNIVYIGPDKTVDWDDVSGVVDLSGYYTKKEVDDIKSNLQDKVDNAKTVADAALDTANTASNAANMAAQIANTSKATADNALTKAEDAQKAAEAAVEVYIGTDEPTGNQVIWINPDED